MAPFLCYSKTKEICLHAQEKILFYGILNKLFQMQADRHGINNLIHSGKKKQKQKKPFMDMCLMIAQFTVDYAYVDSAQILLSFINFLSCFACSPKLSTNISDLVIYKHFLAADYGLSGITKK